MIKSSKLFFIRHAPVKSLNGFFPKHNPDAIIKSIQLKKLAKLIPKNAIWYVSPLKRAIQTAKALSEYIGYSKIIREKKLVEQNYGDWAGKEISVIWRKIKKYKQKHNFSFISPEFTPPNGESFVEQCNRVRIWLEELKFSEGQNIVVVAHAGTIRAAISHVLQINPDNAIGIDVVYQGLCIIEMFSKSNCQDTGGRFRLLALNQGI